MWFARALVVLLRGEVRARVPKSGTVVTVTETGNRDEFVIRHLSRFGFRNVVGLQYGMRGWIKRGFPTRKGAIRPAPPDDRKCGAGPGYRQHRFSDPWGASGLALSSGRAL